MINNLIKKHNDNIDHFIKESLGIKKINFWALLKIKFFRINIKRQDMGYLREKISIYKGGILINEAEFNIKLIKNND